MRSYSHTNSRISWLFCIIHDPQTTSTGSRRSEPPMRRRRIDNWQLSWVELCRFVHLYDATQLNSTSSWVELCRYKRGFRQTCNRSNRTEYENNKKAVTNLKILVLWQHGYFVAINADHSTLKMDQLTFTDFNHVAIGKVMSHFWLWLCRHCQAHCFQITVNYNILKLQTINNTCTENADDKGF